ncbi:Hydrogenase maturation factor HypD [subsurface metagenome]
MNLQKRIRDPELARGLTKRLRSFGTSRKITIMEVCGTHTMAIHRSGLPSLLPEGIRLISGPGCPVCVTPGRYLDNAVTLARKYGVMLTTFGDMMRVPGSLGTLSSLRSEGYDVDVVYSPLNALEIAEKNPDREIVFLAVGFETTAPVVASTILMAEEKKIKNFSILSANKLIIPALTVLINDPQLAVDGFLLPGHVSIVLGPEPYDFIAKEYKRACVIAGFEYPDIVQALFLLAAQIEKNEYRVEIQYKRGVHAGGNKQAQKIMYRVFQSSDTDWRGFGCIPQSGLAVKEEFSQFDASKRFPVHEKFPPEPSACRCGDVLRGLISPHECSLYGKSCSPNNPVGPCMVSSEGTCAAFYRYSRRPCIQGKKQTEAFGAN